MESKISRNFTSKQRRCPWVYLSCGGATSHSTKNIYTRRTIIYALYDFLNVYILYAHLRCLELTSACKKILICDLFLLLIRHLRKDLLNLSSRLFRESVLVRKSCEVVYIHSLCGLLQWKSLRVWKKNIDQNIYLHIFLTLPLTQHDFHSKWYTG